MSESRDLTENTLIETMVECTKELLFESTDLNKSVVDCTAEGLTANTVNESIVGSAVELSEFMSFTENTANESMVDCKTEEFSKSIDLTENTVNGHMVECKMEELSDYTNSFENTANESISKDQSLDRIKFCTLLTFKEKDKMELLRWCMDAGLISSTYLCPSCGKPMKLKKTKEISDGYLWRCRERREGKEHVVQRTMRKGSVFSGSRMCLTDILLIIHCWIYKIPQEWIFLEMGCSTQTVVEWWDFCRSICVEICTKDDYKIGGFGKAVEVIGGKLETRKHKKVDVKEPFAFAGVEDVYADKSFIRVVEKCDKNSFLEVIKNSVLPGTSIVSEFCDIYDCLEDEDFVDLATNYLYKFESYDCTKQRNGFWSVIKKRIPFHTTKEGSFDKYLAEFIWRKNNSCAYDKMRKFILAIKTVFPPSNKDD